MKYLFAAFLIAIASPAFAECAPGYTLLQVPLCRQNGFNIGYTTTPTAGSGNSYVAGKSFANGPYTMSQTGTIQSCSIWIQSVAGGQLQCGVYSAISSTQPGSLLASSALFTPVAGWNTVPTTTNPVIASGTTIFMGGFATANDPTLADANAGFTLYGDNAGDTSLKTPFLNPANVSATTFQLGAYATFNSSVGTAPVINSQLTASGTVNTAFSYQITATNAPTSFNASPLPAGLRVNTSTGVISGTPTGPSSTNVTLSATNAAGTGTATLTLTINSTTAVSKYEYVLNDGSATVYDINALPTVSVVKTLTLPTSSGTRGAVACGDTLYISYGQDGNGSGGHILAWNLLTDSTVYDVTLPFGIDSHSITRDCSKIYMPEGELASNGLWAQINPANGAVLGTVNSAGTGPHNTFIPSAGTHVYMGPRNTGHLVEGNIPANTVARTFSSTTNNTVRPFTVTDDEKFAFVTDSSILGFQTFDVATGNKLFSTTPSGFTCSGAASACSHGIALCPDGTEVWFIDIPNNVHHYDVSALPGTAPTLVGTTTLNHPISGNESPCGYDCGKDGWIHMSLDGHYLFVGDSGDVIDATTGSVIAYLPAMNNTRKEIEIDFANGHVCASMTNRQSSSNPEACP